MEAAKNVPLEVRADAKHSGRGILSMARWDDPNSGAASFSITLGPAPHLDMTYTVFGCALATTAGHSQSIPFHQVLVILAIAKCKWKEHALVCHFIRLISAVSSAICRMPGMHSPREHSWHFLSTELLQTASISHDAMIVR